MTCPPSRSPYDILTTKPGVPFHAVFEFAGPRSGDDEGWRLVIARRTRNRSTLTAGRCSMPDSRLLNLDGDPIVDEFRNIKYASGAVLGWDSGRLGIASVPPAELERYGLAGMVTWDADYLYVCTATDTWKRIALSGF